MISQETLWLVRTQQKQLLGPIDLAALLDLIAEGVLADEDEVCSGNGYWFKLSEKELVQKYIYKKHSQGFDPVSDVESVLGTYAGKKLETRKAQPEKTPTPVLTERRPVPRRSGLDVLYYFAIVFFLFSLVFFLYRKEVLNKLFEQASLVIIPNATAQDALPLQSYYRDKSRSTILGPKIDISIVSFPANCDEQLEPHFLYALIHNESINENFFIEHNRCESLKTESSSNYVNYRNFIFQLTSKEAKRYYQYQVSLERHWRNDPLLQIEKAAIEMKKYADLGNLGGVKRIVHKNLERSEQKYILGDLIKAIPRAQELKARIRTSLDQLSYIWGKFPNSIELAIYIDSFKVLGEYEGLKSAYRNLAEQIQDSKILEKLDLAQNKKLKGKYQERLKFFGAKSSSGQDYLLAFTKFQEKKLSRQDLIAVLAQLNFTGEAIPALTLSRK